MKSKYNLFQAILLAFIIPFTFTACDDDDKAVPESQVSWTLSLPEDIENPTLSDLKVTITNINTNTQYDGSVSMNEQTVTVTATVPEGLYRVIAEGKVSYSISGIQTPTVANIRAYQESVTISGTTVTLPAQVMSFYTPSTNGFVIEEIYFAGSTTPEGKQYLGDQYIKIYNNSDSVLYADGLVILESAFKTSQHFEFTPDVMSQAMVVQCVYAIPGNGKDYPVQPGESILICDKANDHREANSNSFDLRNANFEWYDETKNNMDTDNPEVTNLDKIYCYSNTIWVLNNQGLCAYAIARLKVDRNTFLTDYTYNATYISATGSSMNKSGYQVPNEWIIDAVNISNKAQYAWNVVDASLDMGYTYCGEVQLDKNRYNKSVRRKVLTTTIDGRKILQDTNNSTEDFEAQATPSLKQ